MKTPKLLLILVALNLLFTSCEDEKVTEVGLYEEGFFIVNEGNFGSGNASLSYVSYDYATVEQNIFKKANGSDLGDTAQSIFMLDDKAYIVLNASNKIEVVNRYTMESLTTIESDEIKNPRYMLSYNGFGYVSNWGVGSDPSDDTIVIIDLSTNTVSSTISVGFVPDKMTIINDQLFVILNGWYPDNENKVDVIDLKTNTVVKTIEVGYYPNSIVANNDTVFVMSGGEYGVSAGSISVIDPITNTVTNTIDFQGSESPNQLVCYAENLYYNLNGKVYTTTTSDLATSTEITSLEGSYYAMNAYNDKLYTLDAADWMSEGVLKVFDLSTARLEATVTTGIIPTYLSFN